MIDLQPESDTIINPEDSLTKELQLEGSDNDTNQNQFTGGDETNLLGDGVPGYETTGEDETDDDLANQIQASMTPKPTNKP